MEAQSENQTKLFKNQNVKNGNHYRKKYEIKLTFSLDDKNLRKICFS